MARRSRIKPRIISIALAAVLALSHTPVANAQFFGGIVYDPTNYAQNFRTAVHNYSQLVRQAQQLRNEANMLKHTWQFIKGAALSSLLSIGSELASDDSNDRLTRALQNAGQDTANRAGQRIIDRNLSVQPTLKVRPGWRFNVIVSRDLILKPYGD